MKSVAIIGGGPAGLMASERIATAGHQVTIYDHMPSIGRKFLMAGRGGLNLTHSEALDTFLTRYGEAASWLSPIIQAFPPQSLRNWCHGLGQETFTGSSGRVFPKTLKASPLLRAWLQRLDQLGVVFKLKHTWTGWDDQNNLTFTTPDQKTLSVKADATLLALGGASWPRLGSDGHWSQILQKHQIPLTPFAPSNCGFIVAWSEHFRSRYAGQPLKPLAISFDNKTIQGEAMITAQGIEGGAIYALSSLIRNEIAANQSATLTLDLRPGLSQNELTTRLSAPRGSQSLSNHLRKFSGLAPVAKALLYETHPKQSLQTASPSQLADDIKHCPLQLLSPTPIARAISTAGGIPRTAFTDHFMLTTKPGVFAAGEMLDWEAPTGGYLLQASFATAVAAANGLLKWLEKPGA